MTYLYTNMFFGHKNVVFNSMYKKIFEDFFNIFDILNHM